MSTTQKVALDVQVQDADRGRHLVKAVIEEQQQTIDQLERYIAS